MAPKEVLENFERTAQIWIGALGSYTIAQFTRKPDEESWSIGQVYTHLLNQANYFQLGMLEQCVVGEMEPTGEEMEERGKMIFSMGSFPPIQIKVPPSSAYTPPQPVSIEEVRASLSNLIIRMRITAPLIRQADPKRKARHPAFGMMNAEEWFTLIEMHFRHHLRQKERLDAWLGVESGSMSVAE